MYHQGEKRGIPIDTLRILPASQVASQPIPSALSLNYDDIFKIQRVRYPFALGPVSFSSLASYLDCPACALEQKRRRRAKEPGRFTTIHQKALFGRGEPDARLVGTLLHLIVNFLHDPNSPIPKDHQQVLLADAGALVRFMYNDLLSALREAGKLRLAMFFDELKLNNALFYRIVISPMLLYQREFASTGSVVITAAERFQFKLLSTRHTFESHPDWGGSVTLVGEFDQIRLRGGRDTSSDGGIPAIMEFKKGLEGVKKSEQTLAFSLWAEQQETEQESHVRTVLPSASHAMQLMIYWMAFQTRWDILEKVRTVKGQLEDIRMPLHQDLDLILYNLNDGCQYQLLVTDMQEALLALTNCIFYLEWAMKSGYSKRSSDHDCKKTQLVEAPTPSVQVGDAAISAQECYKLAKEAFQRFQKMIRWGIEPLS